MYVLTIDNFQSLEHAEIKLDGFCTIQGPSNRGKSAVIRALGVLLYNEWEADYIRDGAKECRISLEILKGKVSKIEIIKPKNTYNVYYRNGKIEEYPKIDKDIPENVKEELGLNIVKTERGDKFNLNIQPQLDNLFLISDKEPAITSFLNKIFNIDKYERALKKINADILKLNKKSKKDQKELELKGSELEDIEKEYNSKVKRHGEVERVYTEYTGLKERIKFIEEGESSFKEIVESRRRLEELKSECDWYGKVEDVLKNYTESLNNINDITRFNICYCKDTEEVKKLKKGQVELDRIGSRIIEYRTCVQKVGEVSFYLNDIRTKKENIRNISEDIKEYADIRKGTDLYLGGIIKLKDVSGYINKLNNALSVKIHKDNELKENDNFRTYVQEVLKTLTVLMGVKKGITELTGAIKIKSELEYELREYTEIQIEMKEKEGFIKEVVQKCPTCRKLL